MIWPVSHRQNIKKLSGGVSILCGTVKFNVSEIRKNYNMLSTFFTWALILNLYKCVMCAVNGKLMTFITHPWKLHFTILKMKNKVKKIMKFDFLIKSVEHTEKFE